MARGDVYGSLGRLRASVVNSIRSSRGIRAPTRWHWTCGTHLMRKPIPTKVHGVLDYMTAAFLHTRPRAMGWSRTVTGLLDAAGAAATGYSLMTRYELGLVKVLPMKAHLSMDAVSGATLIGAALVLDEEDAEVRGTLAAIGAWEIAAALLTRTETGDREAPE